MRLLPIVVAVLAGCGSPPPDEGGDAGGGDAAPVDPGDLLAAGSWQCLEGAAPDGDGLRIAPIDRWIVGYQPEPRTANPPIMLAGPHLEVTGGFRISMRLSATAASPALLTLNGRLPIIYD